MRWGTTLALGVFIVVIISLGFVPYSSSVNARVIIKNDSRLKGVFTVSGPEENYISMGHQYDILIDGYNRNIHGVVFGRVTRITHLPTGEQRIDLELLNGLTTSLNHTIKYSPEMSGTVEIASKETSVAGAILKRMSHSFNL